MALIPAPAFRRVLKTVQVVAATDAMLKAAIVAEHEATVAQATRIAA